MRNAEKPHWVYWIYGQGLELLYVGCTKDVEKRLSQHAGSPWFRENARFINTKSKMFSNFAAAHVIERFEILSEQPKFNRAGKARRVQNMNSLTDDEREIAIAEAYAQAQKASSPSLRRYWSDQMRHLINARSPAMVMKLEIEKGLRAA